MPGRIWLTDQGNTFTGKATATISGGQIVKCISGANVLTSTNTITDVAELALMGAAFDTNLAVGVALATGVSGDYIPVATEGIFGLYAGGAIGAGSLIRADGAVTTADAINNIVIDSASGAHEFFGRALSAAASGQLVAVKLK